MRADPALPIHPLRLRVAREFNGLFKSDVGRSLGVTGQYISQLESGVRPVNEEMLEALGDLYGFAPAFFRKPVPDYLDETLYEFRRVSRTTKTERRKTIARAAVIREFLRLIEAEYELPDVCVPTLRIGDFETMEKLTYEVRRERGLTIDQPINNVVRVLENAGVVVLRIPGISDHIDAFAGHGERPIVVHGLRTNSTSRSRSDLSHELGHLVMHRGLDTPRKQREDEANAFAGAFLLPRMAFIRDWPRAGLDWDRLFAMKQKWGASLSMIVYRARELGLLTSANMARAFRFMRSRWGVNEPHEPPAEPPELLGGILAILRDDSGHSAVQELEDTLGWKPRTSRQLLAVTA